MKTIYVNLIVILFCIVLGMLPAGVFAQHDIFTPAPFNEALTLNILNNLKINFTQKIAALPPENKADITRIQNEKWEDIAERFTGNEIYNAPDAQKYMDELVAEVVNKNPVLQGKTFHCYFSRSGVPNAGFIGEGVILFNMGLFTRLQNESQMVFVLCHEIAHFYKDHLDNAINEYVTRINSDEVQKQLRKIKRKNYNKKEELDKLVKDFSFSSGRHSRYKESEADSLAVLWMRNTRFDIGESLTSLAMLDTIDNDSYNVSETLQRTFNNAGYPFQPKWIAKEEGLLGGHATLSIDTTLADSLKTHPDCKARIAALQPLIINYKNPLAKKDVIDKRTFNDLQNRSRYEIIEFAGVQKNFTRSLYYTLALLNAKPADPYLVVHTGKIMNDLYNALKQHTLSKVTDLPAPWYTPGYNMLLQFVQNLYSEDMARISYHYLQQYSPQLSNYPLYKTVFEESSRIAKQPSN